VASEMCIRDRADIVSVKQDDIGRTLRWLGGAGQGNGE
jgi:hypothetical protein